MRREVEDLPAVEEGEAVELPVVPPFLAAPRQPEPRQSEPRQSEPEEARPERLATPADRVAARRRLDRLADHWW